MKQLLTLMALVILCNSSNAQSDSVQVKKQTDTIRVGNMVIVKNGSESTSEKKRNVNFDFDFERKKRSKPANISTNWGIIDIGFANYRDLTNYASTGSYLYNRPGAAPLGKSDFTLRTGKSVNVNIWFFMQRLNLIKHHVNLKYGLGLDLNNYRYKSAISYLEANPFTPNLTPAPVIIRDSISFSKNKLAADYVTVPLMLNFCTTPGDNNRGVSLSVGVSAGYLYSQRNKQKSNERGKRTNKGDYDLEPFKFSYIAELGLGPVHLYGSYAPNNMYKRGLDMRPYTVGLRFSNW
ncbi:MAG: hypothetical protein RL172_1559 [Bacteroidota bacterium]|jgi:hypothetical protein